MRTPTQRVQPGTEYTIWCRKTSSISDCHVGFEFMLARLRATKIKPTNVAHCQHVANQLPWSNDARSTTQCL